MIAINKQMHKYIYNIIILIIVCIYIPVACMRKGWFSQYQLSIVSNLADISVRCTGLLQCEEHVQIRQGI